MICFRVSSDYFNISSLFRKVCESFENEFHFFECRRYLRVKDFGILDQERKSKEIETEFFG